MFGSVILDVAVGLALVYLLMSLICSAAKEGLEALMKKRAIDLELGIRQLLHDPDATGLAKAVYEHPLIDGLFKGEYEQQKGARLWTSLPSYIPAWSFASALLAVIQRNVPAAAQLAAPAVPPASPAVPTASGTDATPPRAASQGDQARQRVEALRQAINAIEGNSAAVEALLTLLHVSGDDIAKVRASIADWFNSAMDRIAGRYKRWSQAVIFGLAAALVALLNVDSLEIGNSLARDPSLRQSLVSAAQEAVKHQDGEVQLQKELNEMRKIGLPVGWSMDRVPQTIDWQWVVMKVMGLVLTMISISFGAPFWFDLLDKFIVIRSTVKPKENQLRLVTHV